MANTSAKTIHKALLVLIVLGLVIDFGLLLMYLLRDKNIAVLQPKGIVAQQQLNLFIYTTVVLSIIGVLTLLVLYFTAWKYRAGNSKSTYQHKSYNSKAFVVSMWLIPSLFAVAIIAQMIPKTLEFHPQQALANHKEPMTIQVISMNWKWLFIYPEHGIASVNFVQIPTDTPIRFEMTADQSPMSSFWIPNLGGQLYSMTTHVNRLHLVAEEPGDYPGRSAEINGHGFANMKFVARASSDTEFMDWVQSTKQSVDKLDMNKYNELLLPSEDHPRTVYSSIENNLFAKVVQKYYEPLATKQEEHAE